MGLSDLTQESVADAIQEFDELGRDEFLERYGFARSRGYLLELEGREYDSKAIAGVAHKYARPDDGPLAASSFSGGDQHAAKRLRELGFEVAGGSLGSADDLVRQLQAAEGLRKLTGPPEHWLTTLNTGFWGLTEDHLRPWEKLSKSDYCVLHSTHPMYLPAKVRVPSGIIGIGRVGSTSRKQSLEWIAEIESGENT